MGFLRQVGCRLIIYVPRRHPSLPSEQGTTVQHLSASQPVVSVFGTTDQQGEVLANPLPTDGIFRLPPMLPVITDISPGRENDENSTRCCKDPITGTSYGPGAGQIRGESSSNSSGTTLGSPTLQSLTVSNECNPSSLISGCGITRPQKVQYEGAFGWGEQGRFEMVEAAGQEEVEISNPASKTYSDDRIRCLNQGLGGSTEHSDRNRCLVSSGSLKPHQLPRVAGNISGSQGIWQVLDWPDSPAPDGQLYSSDICKPKRGHLLPELVPASHFHLGVVPGQEHHTGCRASPRTSQYSSGYRIKISEGPLRLDVEPNGVSEDHDPVGPVRARPACLQVNQTTSPFLQLEAQLRSGDHRHLSARLDKAAGICQSTLVPDTPLSIEDQGGDGKDSHSCHSVEDTDMVSSAVGTTRGLSKSQI